MLANAVRHRDVGDGAGQRARQRVAAGACQSGCEAQGLGVERGIRIHLERAGGQGAGLVEDDRVHGGEPFERGGRFQQDAAPQQPAAGDHLNRRHRESQGAGAGHDQDRDGIQQCGLPGSRGQQKPAQEGRTRKPVHDRRIESGDPVCQGDIAGAALLGQFHQPHDLCQQRALADRRDRELDRGRLVQGAGKDRRSRGDGHWDRFAADGAGIDIRMAVQDFAIDRDAGAGGDQDRHTRPHLFRRQAVLPPVGIEHRHRARSKGQQALGGGTRLAASPAVQIAADQQEEQQRHGTVEIGVLGATHGFEQAHAGGKQYGQGYRHIHVEPAAGQRPGRGAEEWQAGIGDRRQRDEGGEPMQQVPGRRPHILEMPGPDRNRQQHHIGRGEARDRHRPQ